MTRAELEEYLIDEAEYDVDEISEMSNRGLLNAWLTYNGIIGFTDDIIDVVVALNVKKENEWY